jgi:hypothetical protein
MLKVIKKGDLLNIRKLYWLKFDTKRDHIVILMLIYNISFFSILIEAAEGK